MLAAAQFVALGTAAAAAFLAANCGWTCIHYSMSEMPQSVIARATGETCDTGTFLLLMGLACVALGVGLFLRIARSVTPKS